MKKKLVLLIILFFILIGGGLFLWLGRGIKGSPADYQIVENENGKFVENKRAGLTAKVPDGWSAEKIEVLEGSVILASPDAEGLRSGRTRPPLKNGCMMEFGVIYQKKSFAEIQEDIKIAHEGLELEFDDFNFLEIREHKTMQNVFYSPFLGSGKVIYIPTQRMCTYHFAMYSDRKEQERCASEMEQFLKAISLEYK